MQLAAPSFQALKNDPSFSFQEAGKCLSAGGSHTVGLKSNGTVVATGNNNYGRYYGRCEVSSWKNVVAIAAGGYHTVGLKSDGTVVATGDRPWSV